VEFGVGNFWKDQDKEIHQPKNSIPKEYTTLLSISS
jgi:hypothetical protein